MTTEKDTRIVISGGGTGGHIFPAISIANAIKEMRPEAEILFVGAEGKMEMKRIPAAGYEIIGLPLRGLIRPFWKPANIRVIINYLYSKWKIKKTLRKFKPQAAVGVGGYASSATLDAAHELGIPCLIQEQNSFAGLTNKKLASKAEKICVAYEGMERFFPAEKILITGNPVRQNLLSPQLTRQESAATFNLSPGIPTILLVGGSLGARTLNQSVLQNLNAIAQAPIQFIWQTGSYYQQSIKEELVRKGKPDNLYVTDFIGKMDHAYCMADLVISRAGASSISELCLLGKPAILVPSPNVAEDHQTHNAMALVERGAALMVKDNEAKEKLIALAIKTVTDTSTLKSLGEHAYQMAYKDSARIIAEEVLKLTKES